MPVAHVTKMEHYKKRLIHQMELVEQLERKDESSNASSSESLPDAEDSNKREGTEKKERKKRISRKLFRHQNIEIFKPVNDKSTGFLRKIQEKPSTIPESETKTTEAIVQLLQKNGDSNGKFGMHHLPPMIREFRRKSQETLIKFNETLLSPKENPVVLEQNVERSKSTETHELAYNPKPIMQRRNTVCAISKENGTEMNRPKRGRPAKIQNNNAVVRRNYNFSEICKNMENLHRGTTVQQISQPEQPPLDLTQRNVKQNVPMFNIQHNLIQYNPLTLPQTRHEIQRHYSFPPVQPPPPYPQTQPQNQHQNQHQPQNQQPQNQHQPQQNNISNQPPKNTLESDACVKVLMQLLPSFIAAKDISGVQLLSHQINLIKDNTLSPDMQKCRSQMLVDIKRFLSDKITHVPVVSQIHNQQLLSDQTRHIKRTEMFRNVEALATPAHNNNNNVNTLNKNENNMLNNTYRRQISNNSKETYESNNFKQNEEQKKAVLNKPHTFVSSNYVMLENNKFKPTNNLNDINKIENNTNITKNQIHSVQFLIPTLKPINKQEIPSVTEKVIPLESTKETTAMPLTEKIVNVQINSDISGNATQTLIVKEKHIELNNNSLEKNTTTRGTSPITIKTEFAARKSPDVIEIIEVKEEIKQEPPVEDYKKLAVMTKDFENYGGRRDPLKISRTNEKQALEIRDDDLASPIDDKIQKRKFISEAQNFLKKSKLGSPELQTNFSNTQSIPSLPDMNKNYIVSNKNSSLTNGANLGHLQLMDPHPYRSPPKVKKIQDLTSHDVRTILKSNIVARSNSIEASLAKSNNRGLLFQNNIMLQQNKIMENNFNKNGSYQSNIISINGPTSPIITNTNEIISLKKTMLSPNYTQSSPSNNNQDYSLRRNSFDTVSSSSDHSYQEEIKSPIDKRVKPRGKLRYDRDNNTFERYFDDVQEQLYIQNVVSENSDSAGNSVEVIRIPFDIQFEREGTIDDVAAFVDEFKKVEMCAPSEFYRFYRYVAGYQMLNRQDPIAFKTFLDLFNTRGLDSLLAKYLSGG